MNVMDKAMPELEAELKKIGPEIEEAAHQTLTEAGKLGVETARDTRLFKNTGPLRAATNFHSIDRYSGFVLADKPYAEYLEYGNPYDGFIIKPVNASVLHFVANGEEVFARSSKAHGPLPFMQNAEDRVESSIEHLWDLAFDQKVK